MFGLLFSGLVALHIEVECPTFLHILLVKLIAVQLVKWFLIKGWLHLKHCSFFLDVGGGRVGCCGVRDVVRGLCQFLIYDTCDQLMLSLWARKISCWFACPFSLFIAKFNACCGVRFSDSKSIWIDLLFRLDMKRSFNRFSSSVSNLQCGPASQSTIECFQWFVWSLPWFEEIDSVKNSFPWNSESIWGFLFLYPLRFMGFYRLTHLFCQWPCFHLRSLFFFSHSFVLFSVLHLPSLLQIRPRARVLWVK